MDALEQFTVPNMELRNPILDYLKHDDEYNFDIKLQGIDCIAACNGNPLINIDITGTLFALSLSEFKLNSQEGASDGNFH